MSLAERPLRDTTNGGRNLPRKGVSKMVTWDQLLNYTLVIIGIVALFVTCITGNRNK